MGAYGALRSNIMKQNNLVMQGVIPCAAFAKYSRSKPHLNVGTIGKCSKKNKQVHAVLSFIWNNVSDLLRELVVLLFFIDFLILIIK